MIQNPDVWREANISALDGVDPDVYDRIRSTPGAHPDDLLDQRGVHVKAVFETKRYSFVHFGVLIKFRGAPLHWRTPGYETVADEVVVVSTTDKETVWFGSVEQYLEMWCAD
jgi:hypothetical protein